MLFFKYFTNHYIIITPSELRWKFIKKIETENKKQKKLDFWNIFEKKQYKLMLLLKNVLLLYPIKRNTNKQDEYLVCIFLFLLLL